MIRQESLEEISDGRRYGLNDMVRADSNGCRNCSKCCETMTDTIILNPLDVYRLTRVTGKTFEQLLNGYLELNIRDGVILPNMGSGAGGCMFLSSEKRCSIHAGRPDFCRLFPLGRLYENGSYSYILQVGQCPASCSKVKVKKWIDTDDLEMNRDFILGWHELIRKVGMIAMETDDEAGKKELMMRLIRVFYMKPYPDDPAEKYFYDEFFARKTEFEEYITQDINGGQ